LSATKSQQVVRRYALQLAQSMGIATELAEWFNRIIAQCLKHATKDKRKKRPSALEKLNRSIEPFLTKAQPNETAFA
jgi:hypothetical protein